MAIPSGETPAFEQLGGHPPGYQQTLEHVPAPGPHETVPLPSNHTAQSLGPTSAPVSTSSQEPSSSWSSLPALCRYISRPFDDPVDNLFDGTVKKWPCNYISPSGDQCKKPAGSRHWATTHALKEAREIQMGRLTLQEGRIINSQAVLELVETYLPRCLECQDSDVYSARWDSLLRHLEGQHGMTKEESRATVAAWQARTDVSLGWDKMISSIKHLKESR